jgi:hypothetical protein
MLDYYLVQNKVPPAQRRITPLLPIPNAFIKTTS